MTVSFNKFYPNQGENYADPSLKLPEVVRALKSPAKRFVSLFATNLLAVVQIADPFLWFNISSGYQQVISYFRLLQNAHIQKDLNNQ